MPRAATPTPLLDNKKVRKTKTELKARKAVEDQLQKIPSTLVCPTDLDGKSKRVWEDVVKLVQTDEFNFLNDLDGPLLRCYCESVERYDVASRAWRKTYKKQIVSDSPDRQRKLDKCIFEMSRASDEMCKFARALNLTSAERGRIAALQGKLATKKTSAIAKFMNED